MFRHFRGRPELQIIALAAANLLEGAPAIQTLRFPAKGEDTLGIALKGLAGEGL
jgi:hypothetical protein